MRARKRERAVCAAIRRLRSGVLRTAARRWVRVLVRVLVRMLVRVRVQAWAPVMGAGASADMGGTIEGTDADAVAAWVVVAARWRGRGWVVLVGAGGDAGVRVRVCGCG